MPPDFIIIGAPRGGTTWLAKNMMSHPEIFMPQVKEIHFFDRHYEKGIEWYENHFRGQDDKTRGEATPAYMYFENAPARMQKHAGEAKLIASLRHPVERAFSHYLYRYYKGAENNGRGISFEQALEQEPRLIEEGQYANRLQTYYDRFPADNIQVLFFDDIQGRPQALAREIFIFLSVRDDFIPPALQNRINTASTRAGKSKILPKLQSLLLRLKLPGLARKLESAIESTDMPALSDDLKTKLMERYFSEDILRLEQLTGKEFSRWSRTNIQFDG